MFLDSTDLRCEILAGLAVLLLG